MIGTTAVLLVALAGAVVRAPLWIAPRRVPRGPLHGAVAAAFGYVGTIIRSEVIAGFRAGATAYRVLYKSTGYDGRPTAVSGFIVFPDGAAPAGGRR